MFCRTAPIGVFFTLTLCLYRRHGFDCMNKLNGMAIIRKIKTSRNHCEQDFLTAPLGVGKFIAPTVPQAVEIFAVLEHSAAAAGENTGRAQDYRSPEETLPAVGRSRADHIRHVGLRVLLPYASVRSWSMCYRTVFLLS